MTTVSGSTTGRRPRASAPPDASDTDEADEADHTVPCPYCRRGVYENAERCPHCGSYLSHEDAPRRYPLWIVAAVIVCLVVILLVWVL